MNLWPRASANKVDATSSTVEIGVSRLLQRARKRRGAGQEIKAPSVPTSHVLYSATRGRRSHHQNRGHALLGLRPIAHAPDSFRHRYEICQIGCSLGSLSSGPLLGNHIVGIPNLLKATMCTSMDVPSPRDRMSYTSALPQKFHDAHASHGVMPDLSGTRACRSCTIPVTDVRAHATRLSTPGHNLQPDDDAIVFSCEMAAPGE